jgi:hypothetical protein
MDGNALTLARSQKPRTHASLRAMSPADERSRIADFEKWLDEL